MQWYFLKHPPRCQQFASEPKGLPLYSVALGVFNTLSFSSSPLEPGKLLAKVCHSHLWRQYCSSSPTVYFHLPGASGRADLVLRKQQPWVWRITEVGEAALQGFAAAGLSPGSTPHSEKVCLKVFSQWHLGYGKPGPWNGFLFGDQHYRTSYRVSHRVYSPWWARWVTWSLTEAQILGDVSLVGDSVLWSSLLLLLPSPALPTQLPGLMSRQQFEHC